MFMKKLTWKRSDCVWMIWFEVIISWARYRCYFRWDFLQGKEGEGKNPPPALLFTPSPLLQWHRQLQISPVLQPHGKWIQRAEQPQLLLSRTAEQESSGCCLQLDPPQAQAKGIHTAKCQAVPWAPQKTPGQAAQASPRQGMTTPAVWGDTWLSQTREQLEQGSWWCCHEGLWQLHNWLLWLLQPEFYQPLSLTQHTSSTPSWPSWVSVGTLCPHLATLGGTNSLWA